MSLSKKGASGRKTYAYLVTIFDNCKSYARAFERKKTALGNSIYRDPEKMKEYFAAFEEYLEHVRNAVTWWVYTVDVDSTGAARLTDKVQIDLNDIKTLDQPSDEWNLTAKEPNNDKLTNITTASKDAISNYSDVSLKIISCIANQKMIDGTNYRFICYGTKDSKTDLYLVEVHEDKDGKAEITKVSLFNLSAYVGATSEGERKGSDSIDSNGSNTSGKSPQTGNAGVVAVMAMLVFMGILGVYVSVKRIAKKKG